MIAVPPRNRTMRQAVFGLYTREATMTLAEVIRLVQSSQLVCSLIGALVLAGLIGKK